MSSKACSECKNDNKLLMRNNEDLRSKNAAMENKELQTSKKNEKKQANLLITKSSKLKEVMHKDKEQNKKQIKVLEKEHNIMLASLSKQIMKEQDSREEENNFPLQSRPLAKRMRNFLVISHLQPGPTPASLPSPMRRLSRAS